MRRAACIAAALGLMPMLALGQGVASTVHNLSPTGPGLIKAAEQVGVCQFCHISHAAPMSPALWARRDPVANYQPYFSSTAVARPGQPTGASLMCLSCHDGTIALGEIVGRAQPIRMGQGTGRMPPGRGLIGTDLTDDHPVSFEFSSSLAADNGELKMPGQLIGNVRLDSTGQLQCTSCHNAHNNVFGNFLVESNQRSQLCLECHDPEGWAQSSHSYSASEWSGRGRNPWSSGYYSTVADNGCRNCHLPHGAGGPRLLRHELEERTCEACHNGNVATRDVMADINQLSSHRVSDTTLVHDPVENAVVESRHVECADCHDPHGIGTAASGPGVRGVSVNGAEISPATRYYEVCLRCHGDSPDLPPARTPRQHEQSNVRLEIQPTNPSFHPVASVGRSNDVPSLIEPWTTESLIECIDCHNSNAAPRAGGSGAEGPHGSAFSPILVRNYSTLDNTVESAATYSLCYGCHSRDSILSNESFPEHNKHVQGEDTPCNVCHDPHGISGTQGNETNNTHLINFDTSVVSPSQATGQLLFTDRGNRTGTCELSCHGEDHDGFDY